VDLEELPQGDPADTQEAGRLALFAPSLVNGVDQPLAFVRRPSGPAHPALPERGRRPPGKRGREVLRLNDAFGTQDKGVLDDIDELPDIAGPIVAGEQVQGRVADAGEGFAGLAAGPVDEALTSRGISSRRSLKGGR
jgi:hypothetical protein